MEENQKKNIKFYNQKYQNIDIEVNGILKRLNKLHVFLDDSTTTDTSWVGMYQQNFRNKIDGKKILELGCGDCANAAIMAALGAKVFANDIASKSGEIITRLNQLYKFKEPIEFVEGDFLTVDFQEENFDYVVGKAFLHHLTHPVEKQFFIKITNLLSDDGEARFFEPAVNSKVLDELRWYTPVPGRPSKFNKTAFKKWKENDPHPERDNSSSHFEKLGREFFHEVEIIPLGSLERFHRLLPPKMHPRKFRQKAFKLERKLPAFINHTFARSQTIIYRTKR
jgi:2-polyprenyl-3-methyl-5-hydroxy-6-metoxy-1,4-benzoquinol methylase